VTGHVRPAGAYPGMRKIMMLGFLSACSTASAAPAASGHYCNLGVFSPEELARHHELVEKLAPRVVEHRELADGYAFRLPGDFRETGELIDGTRRCCPTLNYVIEFAPKSGPTWLRVTGSDSAKSFIREEFSVLMGK